ncbi:MAG: hypothetical protein UV80_C0001G0038 [Candidatus Peregrinibacteria bacterium GW2011_GWF2_43_17]|nr:MAG: hypothetical protein UV80_C0001G0038 [Candidatus Peregrinibacteria bacterium GW2011_GWF2_43_17]HAU40280.1 hypothetical protein [Candidatus Peregrinibacteria bacterium]
MIRTALIAALVSALAFVAIITVEINTQGKSGDATSSNLQTNLQTASNILPPFEAIPNESAEETDPAPVEHFISQGDVFVSQGFSVDTTTIGITIEE